MKSKTKRVVGTAASLALVSGAALVAVPVAQTAAPNVGGQEVMATYEEQAASPLVKIADVEGTFSYNQSTLTSAETISKVFNKAAAALCQSLPGYEARSAGTTFSVNGNAESGYVVEQVDSEKGDAVSKFVMACVCATNMAGGGAAVNVEAEGVPLSSIVVGQSQ